MCYFPIHSIVNITFLLISFRSSDCSGGKLETNQEKLNQTGINMYSVGVAIDNEELTVHLN